MTQTRPDKSQRFPWNTFLGGKWIKTQPTKPGKYFCATREGVVVGLREWRLDLTGRCVDAQVGPGEPGWLAFTWSIAIPDAPNAPVPEWDEDKGE
jgi:hypothetical protein